MRRLVLLRPEPGASASARRAAALGLETLVLPLFEVRPLPWQAPDPTGFDALLLTSANAIRHGGEQLALYRSLPVKAVGPATAAAARAAGFRDVAAGSGDVAALLATLDPQLRLLHLTGRDRRLPASAGQPITAVAVYAAEPGPPPAGLAAIAGSVVAVHSPRAARRLAELVQAAAIDRSRILVAAISQAAAAAAGSGWEGVAIADRPGDAALLALAARLCDEAQPR